MSDTINTLRLSKTKDLLPIGTVVIVEPITQGIMIYGRKQQQANTDKTWDYVACPYPQGHITEDTNVFFNHDQIKEVIYKGLETEGEIQFRERLKEAFE
ncbi:DUF4176 domain-containing protein [Bacillus tianshenii]|uniref:DUF4176 domain-containing protein n=1 Tax=Sutcliffiella tianshenii TaxID=1463404 RepID=UPI001CD6D96A|nr:DUF4176 domain-containing protein [Bacillus tianshenii]MCA1321581.1 DUF4176 domain-containing protein [Bacillus tianshenii]